MVQTNKIKISTRDLKEFSKSDWRKSTWQIVNSVIPFLILMTAMYFSLEYSYWLTLLLAIPTAGFAIRIFIIFHDCGHGSFFKSTTISSIVGYITGLLLFVPYHDWRHSHAQHHATCSDLDRRGIGDVWTLTVKEYKASSARDQFLYRLYRNPIVLFILGPFYMALINNRFPTKGAKTREKTSVHMTNIGLLLVIVIMSLTIGIKSYLLIQIPVILIAWTSGIWLFYVQHQFEEVYWENHENWDYNDAALLGSSFYKLPRILQWFTGNIGFHHVHHLSARIPNYNLQKCHEQIGGFQSIKPLTFFASLKLLKMRLYDEESRCMIDFSGFRDQHMAMNS